MPFHPPGYYIRVKDNDTRAEFTMPATADRAGVTVIDKPAIDDNGDPLPAKTSVNSGGAKPAKKAASEKESA